MATVSDIVHAALREIGRLATGEVATQDDAQKALDALSRLQDKWNAERLYTYTVTRTTFTITETASFTLGSGATINTPRPAHIDDVRLVDTAPAPDIETPLQKLNDQEWAAIQVKALTAALPTHWYYNATYPNGTLYLWPIPTQSSLQGAVYAATPITRYTALSTEVSLPPGYEEMLVTNLAVRLAPMFGQQVHPDLRDAAKAAMHVIKRINLQRPFLKFDAGALLEDRQGVYDITRDW